MKFSLEFTIPDSPEDSIKPEDLPEGVIRYFVYDMLTQVKTKVYLNEMTEGVVRDYNGNEIGTFALKRDEK